MWWLFLLQRYNTYLQSIINEVGNPVTLFSISFEIIWQACSAAGRIPEPRLDQFK